MTVDPADGCRVESLRIGGTEVLRQPENGKHFGSFPMVPWCGRTENGRFRDGEKVHQLPVNAAPHAIHGTGRDVRWRTVQRDTASASFTYDLTSPWPYAGRVTQTFALTADSVTLTMGVETYDNSFPAQVGWHPWFRRGLGGPDGGGADVEIAFDAAWQEERGDNHLPTGRRIDPLPSPWDDCFGMPDGVDVTLTWPGQLELRVTSREEWVVVYDEQAAAVCVEPQTGPPNGLNTLPRLVTPVDPLEASMTWSWRRLS
ncbi:aldose 1-epimerase [Streptomyces sp. NPDC051561]|uniref:aldose epimerase family protein n=1 Tax=Streptomyces sp. NPDC051561 TaxID=3365658 RepID=UPI0037A0DC11